MGCRTGLAGGVCVVCMNAVLCVRVCCRMFKLLKRHENGTAESDMHELAAGGQDWLRKDCGMAAYYTCCSRGSPSLM